MNNQIKGILNNLKEWSVDGNLYFEINDKKAKLLYKFITDLQKELEILRSAYIGEKLKNDKVIHFICYEYRPQRPTTKEEEIIINILRGDNNE